MLPLISILYLTERGRWESRNYRSETSEVLEDDTRPFGAVAVGWRSRAAVFTINLVEDAGTRIFESVQRHLAQDYDADCTVAVSVRSSCS